MIFHPSQTNGLGKLKSLFPELTEKQFLLTLRWVLGADLVDLSIDNESSIDGVKKALQRSKIALGVERLDSVRPLFLSRVAIGLFMVMNDN